MRYILTFLLFLFYFSCSAQHLAVGFYHAHGNQEIRFGYGNIDGHHEWQVFLEAFIKPQGDVVEGAIFNGKRYAYDSLDYVGLGGRYAYHYFKEKKRISPYLAVESQIAPTALRLRLLAPDGTYKTLNFRNTKYWDNFIMLGSHINLNSSWTLDFSMGGGFAWIFGIPNTFTINTKSGLNIDPAFFIGGTVRYNFSWRSLRTGLRDL